MSTTPMQSPSNASYFSSPADPVALLPNIHAHMEISGLLHKKRGGFGRILTSNPWQQRFFTVSKYLSNPCVYGIIGFSNS
jgi:hypothetical protein